MDVHDLNCSLPFSFKKRNKQKLVCFVCSKKSQKRNQREEIRCRPNHFQLLCNSLEAFFELMQAFGNQNLLLSVVLSASANGHQFN